MAAQQRPGCFARAGQWLVYLLAGLLIGAIVAGALHAWNPNFGILPAAYTISSRVSSSPAPELPTMVPTPLPTQTAAPTAPAVAPATPMTGTAPVTTTGAAAAPASAEESAFLDEAQTLFVTYVGQLEAISQRLMAALETPALAEEAAWRDETATLVAEMRTVGTDVRALISPPRYAAAWDEMRIATVFFDRALDALTLAVDTRAPDQIADARTNLKIAVDAVNRAAAALQAAMPTPTP